MELQKAVGGSAKGDKSAEAFYAYYKKQLGLSEDDTKLLFDKLAEPLPITFRLVGALSEGDSPENAEIFHHQLLDMIAKCDEDGEEEKGSKSAEVAAALKRLEWYPNTAAWQLNIDKKDMRKNIKTLQDFLLREVSVGNIVRMEAVSMIPAIVLGPRPGELVLDMCAAPGSKTGQLLEMVVASGEHGALNSVLQHGGAVLANDPDIKRARMMIHRAKSLSSPSLVVTALPGQSFPKLLSDDNTELLFDRVLCDVPCSGDGTIRKSPYTLKRWHPTHGIQIHLLQLQLLRRSVEITKVGGRIVYSTCSLNPLENEAVVAQVVADSKGALRVLDCPPRLSALRRRKGLTSWSVPDMNSIDLLYDSFDSIPEARNHKARERGGFSKRGLLRSMFPPSSEDADKIGLERCMRFYPQDADTGGFFVTLLEKTGDVDFSGAVEAREEGSLREEEEEETQERKRRKEDALPKDYVDKCTKQAKVEKRVNRIEPYIPLLDVQGGGAIWASIADFFGISETFPARQLLANSVRVRTITFVTAPSRRALNATIPAGGPQPEEEEAEEGKAEHRLNVVTAGTRMLEESPNEDTPCRYRLCMDGLVFILPFITKRIVDLELEPFMKLLQDRQLSMAECPKPFEDMANGSAIAILRLKGMEFPVLVWRGRSSIRLFVASEESESLLSKIKVLAKSQ